MRLVFWPLWQHEAIKCILLNDFIRSSKFPGNTYVVF
jgi:hypothetical protein